MSSEKREELLRNGWPEECVASEERFGSISARFYPLLKVDNGVRTPRGLGTLLTVLSPVGERPGTGQVLLLKTRTNKLGYRPMTTFPLSRITPVLGAKGRWD